jgi:PKD repeat protein
MYNFRQPVFLLLLSVAMFSCDKDEVDVKFEADRTVVTAGESVTFKDNSEGTPTSLSWNFEGGTPSTSTEQEPVVTYTTPGVYDVSLFASNDDSQDSENKTAYITVEEAPVPLIADFTVNNDTITVGEEIQFTDQSTGEPTSWSWTFEGGTPNSSSEQNPEVTYETPGVYAVTLGISNAADEDDTTRSELIVVLEQCAENDNFECAETVTFEEVANGQINEIGKQNYYIFLPYQKQQC